MGKFTLTHEIQCDPETFWRVFLDKDFNTELFRDALGFPKFDIVEQRENDREIIRKVSGTPKMDVPGPVAKVLGSSFSYVEEGRFDKSSKTWHWKMIPSTMADKMKTEGIIRVEPAGEGKCRRIADVTLEAKIFGIGGMMESAAEKNLRQGYDASATFMNKYIRDGKAK
jgi:hypothetical protein